MSGSVWAEVDAPGRLARVVLDRPERRNALDLAMWRRLAEVVRLVGEDPAVAVVVVEGAAGHFAAGADIGEFDEARVGEATLAYDCTTEAALAAIEAVGVPTVALVEGACLGGGVSIVLACDVVVATTQAFFGVPASGLGTLYPHGAIARLVRRVGDRRARALLLGGWRVGAADALGLGLADRVVADRAEGIALARAFGECSSLSQQATKRVLADPEAHERLSRVVFSSQDYAEGRLAFAERRAARFMGPALARALLERALEGSGPGGGVPSTSVDGGTEGGSEPAGWGDER